MTCTFHDFPVDDAIFARLTEQQRLANMQAERDEAVKAARLVLRAPGSFTSQDLRDACAVLQNLSDDPDQRGLDWLRADAMIYALNRREREQAHEAARRSVTPVAAQYRWQDVVAGTAAFVFVGWAVLTLVLGVAR